VSRGAEHSGGRSERLHVPCAIGVISEMRAAQMLNARLIHAP